MQYLTLLALIALSFWFISQNAKGHIPRLLFSITGLYFLLGGEFYTIDTAIGVGLIAPHLYFLYLYIKLQIFIITRIGVNSYYLLLSFYFKIYNFFVWFKSLFDAIKIFFTTRDFSQAKHSYEEDNPQEEEFNYSKYEEQQHQYEQASTDEIEENIKEEYRHLYSKDPYVVLGVSPSDSKQTIKKAFRKLMGEHHPDRNQDRIEEATIITQNINNAYETLKKKHS